MSTPPLIPVKKADRAYIQGSRGLDEGPEDEEPEEPESLEPPPPDYNTVAGRGE